MEASNNQDFVTESFHRYQDVNIPLMPVRQLGWDGHLAQQMHPVPLQRERYTAWRLLIDLASIAWTVPISFAVYINLTSWIVGRGVSCKSLHPNPNCFGGMFTPDRHERLEALYEEDRAILGALQVVAKALETWFSVIATSIVFSVTMRLATSPDGLPLGYLFTHVSFPDLLGLFDRRLWTSWAGPNRHGSAVRLWGFIFLVFILCVESNLMGPATAILIIPQIGTPVIEVPTTKRFEHILAPLSPRNANMVPGCDGTELAAGNFSCTKVYSSSLDEMSSGSELRLDLYFRGWIPVPLMSEHDGVLFTFNSSRLTTRPFNSSGGQSQNDLIELQIIWAPCRAALKEITADYMEVIMSQRNITSPEDVTVFKTYFDRAPDPSLYESLNNTLDIALHRIAPSLGAMTPCARASRSFEYFISETKSVRCLNLTILVDAYRIACSQTGSGWGDNGFAHSQFSIADTDNVWPSNVSVNVYTATKTAVFHNRDPRCGTATPCDWDGIFALGDGENREPGLSMDSTPYQFVEYTKSHPSGHHIVFCSTRAHLSFSDYLVNVLPDQNPIGLAQVNVPNIPPNATFDDMFDTVTLHPDWMLAAWSITGPSNTVEATQPAAINLISALKSIGAAPQSPEDQDAPLLRFQVQHEAVTFHALTFVGFSTTNVTAGEVDDDPKRPFLKASKTLRVYMYDAKSRTVKAAIAVCIVGCAVALVGPVVSYLFATRRPSTLRFVVAALQHQPLGSLEGVQKERDLGRVLVRVEPHPEDRKAVALRTPDETAPPGPR